MFSLAPHFLFFYLFFEVMMTTDTHVTVPEWWGKKKRKEVEEEEKMRLDRMMEQSPDQYEKEIHRFLSCIKRGIEVTLCLSFLFSRDFFLILILNNA